MRRNVNDYFSKTPTPHYPRNKFDFGVHKRLQTQGHGRLYPFYCRMVYPGDTWQMDASVFVRADTSVHVPLDDIYLDTYFFFVPLRILGDDFKKALGEVDAYDDDEYNFPLLHIEDDVSDGDGGTYQATLTINNLLTYLGYSQAESQINSGERSTRFDYVQDISAYPMAAYYCIWNEWFRDENVDNVIPYEDLYNGDYATILALDTDGLFDNFDCLKVNKYHDYFTSGVINPTKSPNGTQVAIPLGLTAPIGVLPLASGTLTSLPSHSIVTGDSLVKDEFFPFEFRSDGGVTGLDGSPVIADLSKAAGTINELYLAMALNSLYNKKARFGTRYIEQIRGLWGIEVPDSFFQRPEYLGGSRTTLNMLPVLSTENSSQLGQMAGNSSTTSKAASFTKTFVEYGLILGLSCTRVKHSYTQGFKKEIFGLKTQLDLYNPVFANIGFEPVWTNELYNQGDSDNSVFNYQEAWAYLRTEVDSFAGLFGIFSGNNDIRYYWHYGDYYTSKPVFSSGWLKEDFKNVARTMSGRLIADAPNVTDETEGHQFMFGYYFHPVVTRILPSHSLPPELTGRI